MNIVGIFVLKTLFLLFQASQYGLLHRTDVCIKERSHIPPVIFPTYQNLLIVYLKPIYNNVTLTTLVFHSQLLQTAVVCLMLFRYHSVVPNIWQLNYVYVLA